jgi:long-chain acyl-CoA synthetase
VKKNMMFFVKNNSKDLNYVVSVEVKKIKDDISTKELKIKEINQFVNYLGKIDIGGKRIGLLIENSNDFVKAFYGIILNGKIPVSINNCVQINEFNDIVKKNNLEYVITSNKFVDLVSKCKVNHIININKIDCKMESEYINFNISDKQDDDVFVISYTSGTSGNFSKGVELTYKNITFVSNEYKKIYKLSPKSKIITVLPLWHNYAMFACLTSSIVSKATLVIMKSWDSELFLNINKLLKPDIFPGSPYMYIDLINNYNENLFKLKNLKICDCGGDSLPIECILKFEKSTGAVITEGYGLTETASLTHFNYSASERKIGSLGKPIDHVKCKILDLYRKPVSSGSWGLLWIKGPMVFKDYVNLPGYKDKVKVDGWFNTNDVVRCDDSGYYYIAGRLSDLRQISKNGNQLRDLENSLYKFKGIKRVFVKADYNSFADFYCFDIFAVLKKKYKICDLYDYINTNLKKYVIRDVKIVDNLPTTGTGKVKREEINAMTQIDINDYSFKELSGGLRCKTYFIHNGNEKKIYQEYYENTQYQAEKKYNITNMIKESNPNVLIPNAYSWGKDNEKTWLLTEYMEGQMLNDIHDENFKFQDITKELAKTLFTIHSTKVGNKYGWITDNSVIPYETFSDYLSSELFRFESSVKGKIDDNDFNYMIDKAKKIILKIKKYDNKLKPQLIWFDLNPNNILINKTNDKYNLSAVIDAGGAKYGIKEWDLAFIKMEVCHNDNEFISLFNEYKKLDKNIDANLINYLSIFIELDDMIIRILDHEKLPMPYDTNFKSIIEKFL